jgi:hypothetical protein
MLALAGVACGQCSTTQDKAAADAGAATANPGYLFAYRVRTTPQVCLKAKLEGRAVVRGYSLAFAGGNGEGPGAVATLRPDRADATVPGLLFALEPDCLARLDAEARNEGYVRREVAGEFNDKPISAHTFLLPEGANKAIPDAEYVQELRAAWSAVGLDTRAIDAALAQR